MAKRPTNRASTVSDDGFVTLFDDAVVQDVRTALAAKGRKQRDVERIIHTLCDRLIDDQWALAKWLVQQKAAESQTRKIGPALAQTRAKKALAKRQIAQAEGKLKKWSPTPDQFATIEPIIKAMKDHWDAVLEAEQVRLPKKLPRRPKPSQNAVAVLVDAGKGLTPGGAAKFVARLYGHKEWLERAIQRIKALQMLVTSAIKIKEAEIKVKESAGGYSKIVRETLRLAQIDAFLMPPLSDREEKLRNHERRAAIPLDALLALRDQLEGERKTYEAASINVASLTTMGYPKKA